MMRSWVHVIGDGSPGPVKPAHCPYRKINFTYAPRNRAAPSTPLWHSGFAASKPGCKSPQRGAQRIADAGNSAIGLHNRTRIKPRSDFRSDGSRYLPWRWRTVGVARERGNLQARICLIRDFAERTQLSLQKTNRAAPSPAHPSPSRSRRRVQTHRRRMLTTLHWLMTKRTQRSLPSKTNYPAF